ncbi:Mov34-domain-containing protein [Nadsonia fulvescens var. elongata DSM 6958]|uniref:Mov34-domain-containing protein n=1 Tax=Nadsonia fulvescens var. elongata DSM 6958 TaxID=857566 RepID=A0A1E3PNE7_9ASCO|nr:Mov34-domain-containing protein [Nadsonia fulvescens var. elongata DSM 6958]
MPASTIHIPRAATAAVNGIASPQTITVQAQAVVQILDHALRQSATQKRVIGTLLGSRSEDGTEYEVRSTYAVSHEEADDRVTIDIEGNKAMYNLLKKTNQGRTSGEVILGWYSTSSDLDYFAGLVHKFYSSPENGAYPFAPIYLSLDSDIIASNGELTVSTFTSSAIGAAGNQDAVNTLFVPIPNEIKYSDIEKAGLDVIAKAQNEPSRSTTIESDLQNLESSLLQIMSMIERVQEYVQNVIKSADTKNTTESVGNVAVGKYLLDSLSLAPGLVKADAIEELFNTHLRDVLMIVYLANTVKTQLQLSSRLTTLL